MTNFTFDELAAKYCERQEQTPSGLWEALSSQRIKFHPAGWMLLECQMLDSSRLGSLTLLPFGPNNTYKEITTAPISPRGLASDMSICVGVLLVEALPELRP